MATYPVYDEHGGFVGDFEWSEIPVRFKDRWYLEKGTFHLTAHEEDAAEERPQIVLVDTVTGGTHEFTHEEFAETFGFEHTSEVRTVQDVIAIHRRMRSARNGPKTPVRELPTGPVSRYRVTRDVNGCFLGAFSREEVLALWPDATERGLVYFVPRTVAFDEATSSIGRMTHVPSSNKRKHIEASVRQAARQYPLEGMEGDAEAYWSSQYDVAWSVVGRSGKPLCVVPYSLIGLYFGSAWFCSLSHVAQLLSPEDALTAQCAETARLHATELYSTIGPVGEGCELRARRKTRHGPSKHPNAPLTQRREFVRRLVARDANGCFLGVYTLGEARLRWPEARVAGPMIVVPETVAFDDAADAVAHVTDFDIPFAQKRYADSVMAARSFAQEHRGMNAAEYWETEIDRPVSVTDNTSHPLGHVTPRMLQETLGDGWFLVSDAAAQVMTSWGTGRVRNALKDVIEDASTGDQDVWAKVPTGMRAVVSRQGAELFRCTEADFGHVYRLVLRRLPAGSYDVSLKGVRLKSGLRQLGYASLGDFKGACGRAVEQQEEKREARSVRRKPPERDRHFTVWDHDGSELYACGRRRANAVAPRVKRMLPSGSYVEVEGGLRLRRPLRELGFASAKEFAEWVASGDGESRNRVRTRETGRAAGDASFDGAGRVLHVFKGTLTCRRRGHKVEPATGELTTLEGKRVKINVNYCADCDMYFLGASEYRHYRERYGPILGNYRFDRGWPWDDTGFENLAAESPLMLCGYNVRESEGLSSRDRHLILANVMDCGILSKPRVIEYLRYFINRSKNRANMAAACGKWREDLAWVRDYRIDRQRQFTVSEVRRFR